MPLGSQSKRFGTQPVYLASLASRKKWSRSHNKIVSTTSPQKDKSKCVSEISLLDKIIRPIFSNAYGNWLHLSPNDKAVQDLLQGLYIIFHLVLLSHG